MRLSGSRSEGQERARPSMTLPGPNHKSRTVPYLISFEGLPGTGKTTLSRLVASRLAEAGVNVRTIDFEVAVFGSKTVLQGKSIGDTARFLIYLGALLEAFSTLERYGAQVILADRYFATVAAQFMPGILEDLPNSLRLPKPGLSVLLEAPQNVLRSRLMDRGSPQSGRKLYLIGALYNQVSLRLRAMEFDLVLDTNTVSASAAACVVLQSAGCEWVSK